MSDPDYMMHDIWSFSRAPTEDWRLYPGRKVLHPHFYDGEYVYSLKPELGVGEWTLKYHKEIKTIDSVLESLGVPKINDRWAMLVWDHLGAPCQLRALEITKVVLVPVILEGFHVVFAGRRANEWQAGSLARWEGHRYPTFVAFFDEQQMELADQAQDRATGDGHLVRLLEGKVTITGGPQLKEIYTWLPDNRHGLLLEDDAVIPLVNYWQGEIQEKEPKMKRAPITDYVTAEVIPNPQKPPLKYGQNKLDAPSMALPLVGH